ncbi:hypothetical protein O3G_MSEX010265 [Manduca sexta]|uniref:ZAD domain-containing protein n=1 Tax=Manduca sexta TaxID=7130 RepID=A0A922CT32_MANSE|nr:hypothetical protein O3G_MSEX010265 [Manduca sexta]
MRTYTRRRPEIQVIEGVHNLCRLCLEKSEEMLPIFAEGSDGICATLSLRIMICVGLEVTNEDCLPNLICSNCHKELNRYYTFRKKCEVSYQKLKFHLQATREKESLQKAIEEREQEQGMRDNIHCLDKCDKTFTRDEFSDIHVLELNTLNNIIVNREKSTELQESCNVNTEIVNCTDSKEIEAQIHDADNPEISSFLSTVLIQLGILEHQDSTMSIMDHGVHTLELVMGDDDTVMLELTEEDDDSAEESQALGIDKSNPVVLNGIFSGNDKCEEDAATIDKAEEQVMTIK